MYIGLWDTLAAELGRVLATGFDPERAKAQLCQAIADRKIAVRVHCADGGVIEGRDINLPGRLNPDDLDWSKSLPGTQWHRRATIADHYEDRDVTIDVSLIELRTKDVTGIFRLATGTAVASTDGIDQKVTTAVGRRLNIKPAAKHRAVLEAESLVPRSFPADTLPVGGEALPGFDALHESWSYYQTVAFLAYGSAAVAARYGGPDNTIDGGQGQRARELSFPLRSGLPGIDAVLAIKDPVEREIALYGTVVKTSRWRGGKGCFDEPDKGRVESRNPDGWEAADAKRWLDAVTKLYQAMLGSSVTAYRGTAAYGLCGLIDPAPAATWARGLSGAEACRFLPTEVLSLIDGRAIPAVSEVTVERPRESATRPIAPESASLPNWKPLMDAVEWADSALGADAWGLMKEWNQAGVLPMQGRADGTTQDFQRHWFDYPSQWGFDEPAPMLPADETSVQPLAGPGRTISRPGRTVIAPSIAATIEVPLSLRLTGTDDILWFDRSAARAKGADVPNRVSNILVEMTALRRLVRELSEQDIGRDVSEERTAGSEALETEVDLLPIGCLFIDAAVEQIKERLRISEGPALMRLLDKMHTGEVRTWKKRSRDVREKVRPAAWEGAHVDLDMFRAQGHSGILFRGSHYHLHRF